MSGWACACSRPLWVPPTNSPVRLGVSPTATSTPTGVSNTCAGVPGCEVCFTAPPFLPVYLCANVGLRGLPAAAWPAPFHNPPPHRVHQRPPCHASPLCPSCPSPPLLSVWMNVSSLSPWLLDFHTVRFSVSSGCFFFFKLLLSFFWLCEEAQCVYLCLHLGQKSVCPCS